MQRLFKILGLPAALVLLLVALGLLSAAGAAAHQEAGKVPAVPAGAVRLWSGLAYTGDYIDLTEDCYGTACLGLVGPDNAESVQLGPGLAVAYLYAQYDYGQPPPRLIVFNDMPDLGTTYNNHVRSVRLGQPQPSPTATVTDTPVPVPTEPVVTPIPPTATATATPCYGHFADVFCGTTFYSFIEDLAVQNVVSGYGCGSMGEPCDPNNTAYFRPNNHITRGQMAKIVAIAGGYTDPNVNQLFQDVEPGSTFYPYIQALGQAQIVSGHQCGGVGEPCVPPQNLPYYEPSNNITRAQAAKIVDLALAQIRLHAPPVTH